MSSAPLRTLRALRLSSNRLSVVVLSRQGSPCRDECPTAQATGYVKGGHQLFMARPPGTTRPLQITAPELHAPRRTAASTALKERMSIRAECHRSSIAVTCLIAIRIDKGPHLLFRRRAPNGTPPRPKNHTPPFAFIPPITSTQPPPTTQPAHTPLPNPPPDSTDPQSQDHHQHPATHTTKPLCPPPTNTQPRSLTTTIELRSREGVVNDRPIPPAHHSGQADSALPSQKQGAEADASMTRA